MITDAIEPAGPEAQSTNTSVDVGGDERAQVPEARKAAVKKWLSTIKAEEKKWEADFKRMRRNMEFAARLQWEDEGGNDGIEEGRYKANMTVGTVQRKVSGLYARDPKAVFERRERRDFVLWDGKVETIAAAFQKVQLSLIAGVPPDPNAMALLNDYQHGKQLQEEIDNVGASLEIVYQTQIDSQEPDFKKQMKQLVRRVVTCGVGYVKLTLEAGAEACAMTGDGVASNPATMLQQVKQLLLEMTEDGATKDDPRVEEVKALVTGIEGPQEAPSTPERLSFAFPSATSIIPDKKCRCLKDFVGCDHVTEKFRRPLSEVEAYFEVKLDMSTSNSANDDRGTARALDPDGQPAEDDPMIDLFEVYDKRARTRFIVCNQHDDYLVEPETISPPTRRFWPWFSLCFNDVEVEDDLRVSIFPPSDVELMMPAQKELNRSRDALRDHRTGAIPFFIATAPFTKGDVERLKGITANDVIQFEGLPAGTDASKVLVAFQPAPLNPEVYSSKEVMQDILATTGAQEANIGPTSGATATESSIAENSRLSHASSNVDDLDDLLSDLAKAGGELLLRGMPVSSAALLAGVGTVWPPTEQVEQFVNRVFLIVEAASSGRPNRAMDENKFKIAAPLLLQAGANPKAIIEWGKKVLDIHLPLEEMFPVSGPAMPGVAAPGADANGPGGPPPSAPEQNQLPAPVAAAA